MEIKLGSDLVMRIMRDYESLAATVPDMVPKVEAASQNPVVTQDVGLTRKKGMFANIGEHMRYKAELKAFSKRTGGKPVPQRVDEHLLNAYVRPATEQEKAEGERRAKESLGLVRGKIW